MTDPKTENLKKATAAQKALNAELKAGIGPVEQFDKAVAGIVGALDNARTSATGLVSTFMGADGFGEVSLSSIISHTNKMSGFSAAMNKATGQAGNLSAALKEHRKAADGMAVGYQELTEHMTKIYIGMTDFSKLSDKAQGEMAGLASKMTKLGISVEDTAANLDIMTRGLHMTWQEAKKTQMDIAKVARSLGVAPAQAAKDWAKAAPKLIQYGKQMKKEFFKLQSQAKATGIEMNDLLGITEKFDTYEGAAEQVSQLNAVFGTTINSVDMLMATDSERINLLKSSVSATGKSWDSMGRWEKKALAAVATQGDLNKAARLFGTNTEEMQKAAEKADPRLIATKELTKAMKASISRGEGMAAMLEGIMSMFAKTFMPIVNTFTKFFTTDVVPKLNKVLGWIDEKLKSMTKAFEEMGEEGKWLKDMVGWAIAIAMGLGPVMNILGGIIPVLTSIGGLVTAIFTPWSLVLVGIAMAIVLIKDNWKEVGAAFRHFFTVSWPEFKGGFMTQWDEMWGDVKAVWMGVWTDIENVFLDIATMMGATTTQGGIDWRNLGKMAAGAIASIVTVIGDLVKEWVRAFKEMAGESEGLFDSFKDFFGPGGTQIMFGTFQKFFWDMVGGPINDWLGQLLTNPLVKEGIKMYAIHKMGMSSEEAGRHVERLLGAEGGLLDPNFIKNQSIKAQALIDKGYATKATAAGLEAYGAGSTIPTGKGAKTTTTTPKVTKKDARKPRKPASTAAAAAARDRVAAEAAARSVTEARFVINIDRTRFVDKIVYPALQERFGNEWEITSTG